MINGELKVFQVRLVFPFLLILNIFTFFLLLLSYVMPLIRIILKVFTRILIPIVYSSLFLKLLFRISFKYKQGFGADLKAIF